MTKTIIKVIFGTLMIISSLSAQREMVGVEYYQHDRGIDSLITKSNILLMSYRNELASGTRFAASLGLDYVKFFEDERSTSPTLKSTNQIFVQLEGLQKYYYMYLKGAVQYYSISGSVIETTGGHSEVLHDNIYKIFEFPLSAGFTFPIDDVEFYIGLNKTYFYGTNKKEIIVRNGGNETNLGSLSKRTFKTNLGLGAETTVLYQFSDKLEFELNLIKYKDKDFSFSFSIWGPLKRMLYIN